MAPLHMNTTSHVTPDRSMMVMMVVQDQAVDAISAGNSQII